MLQHLFEYYDILICYITKNILQVTQVKTLGNMWWIFKFNNDFPTKEDIMELFEYLQYDLIFIGNPTKSFVQQTWLKPEFIFFWL